MKIIFKKWELPCGFDQRPCVGRVRESASGARLLSRGKGEGVAPTDSAKRFIVAQGGAHL